MTDVTWAQSGRDLEVEAIFGGKPANEMSFAPSPEDDALGLFPPEDDIQETDERIALASRYVSHAQLAFAQRELSYPFEVAKNKVSLRAKPAEKALAEKCALLSEIVSLGNSDSENSAKNFEERAVRGLHRLMGGTAFCVGAPRRTHGGAKAAVVRFRELAGAVLCRPVPETMGFPPAGDFGADAFWILGKRWGGPIVYLQAKNSPFSVDDVPQEFLRLSDVLLSWFGRRLDQNRVVVRVLATNSIMTLEQKEAAYETAGLGAGYHIIDAVDILHTETLAAIPTLDRDSLELL